MFLLFFIKKFWKTKNSLQNIFYWDTKISFYKFLEIEFFKGTNDLIRLECDFRITGRDHAGINIIVGVLGYEIISKLYDQRHWDYANDTWESKHV